ncbi:hypothetical protein [Xanthomonas arboricola]|uniref:hypothetical protein n=1 Tax=Xanthomonas arboricola TaxID=56448 RepID=UPI0011B0DD70|nr:hypothetical protein [Xanthomonas arboricola]
MPLRSTIDPLLSTSAFVRRQLIHRGPHRGECKTVSSGVRKLTLLPVLAALTASCAHFVSSKHGVMTFTESVDGRKVRTLEVCLTDLPADTCLSGDWKVAKVLKDSARGTDNPAYIRRGDTLELLLFTGICDSYDAYVGKLEETSFHGEHVNYGLFHNKALGVVSGTYARP